MNPLKKRDFDVRLWFSFWFQGEREDLQFPCKIFWNSMFSKMPMVVQSMSNQVARSVLFKNNVCCGVFDNQIVVQYFLKRIDS